MGGIPLEIGEKKEGISFAKLSFDESGEKMKRCDETAVPEMYALFLCYMHLGTALYRCPAHAVFFMWNTFKFLILFHHSIHTDR